jgi:hypothetical protein
MLNRLILTALLLCILLSGGMQKIAAQNAPVTTCSTVSGAVPGNVAVPVTVTGFTGIGAISLSIDYDHSVMQFVQGIPISSLPGFQCGDSDLGTGLHRISMGWYGQGTNLPDGTTIMTLVFTYVSGNSPLTWFENGSSCEYADAMGNVLEDTPTENYYLNGYVCGLLADPGTISGNNTVCQGQEGEIYSVVPVDNVNGYNWTLPDGAVIISGTNTNIITVNYSNAAISGSITVCGYNECGNGPVSSLSITVNTLPVANAGNDFAINYGTSTTLTAAPGGSGSFSYHWSPEELLVDPDVQNPQTVILTSTTIFSLVVTNQAGLCQSSDEVIVTITGGPLSVNPTALPSGICIGDAAQLYANAGGGSGNYQYLWTCIPPDNPPWTSILPNPVVTPESSRQYLLHVNDGFTEINGSVNVTVSLLPTSTIYGDTSFCGPGNLATLHIDLTGTPPWSFNCTNGITTVIITGVNTSPYDFITMDPGTYSVVELQDANCSGTSSGTATVTIFPVPEIPEITMLDFNLISNICCGNQWYLDNEPIPGATGQAYLATESGAYYDIVTLNGCSSDTSEVVDVIVGIEEYDPAKIILYPNPADDFVHVHYPVPLSDKINITIYSPDGRINGIYGITISQNRDEYLIDIHYLTPGLYFVSLSSGILFKTTKLIVR